MNPNNSNCYLPMLGMKGSYVGGLLLFAASAAYGQAAPSAKIQDISHVRLDAHPTPENSVLFTFGNGGPTMRLPRVIFPLTVIPNDPQKAIKAEQLEFSFWYPDMTPSDWKGTMTKFFEQQDGKYVPEKDRFRVHVFPMFYANPEWDDLSPERSPNGPAPEPRPARVEINRYVRCSSSADKKCVDEMERFDSGIDGLDALLSRDWAEKNPNLAEEDLRHPDKNVYFANKRFPDELFMSCMSIECDAFVYNSQYQLQYRVYFSSESVSHTGDLVRAIDKMIALWSGK
ncbi:hypothetical protein [Solimonas terrae]|uniref:Uncharacterized protein n=1 Tax=Solimonas terrae TaxID=1396819 RepID=A0A6M2BKU5_9GAMM|nr:hypothetical protein [Solimonas terrae]NGY03346.1 hypothetical protein [Solimonas terrae]